MRVGVLSDIHANRVALDAVFDDMPDVDALVCAGDVVGYNPWPAACVEALRERDVPTVMGNHDRKVATDSNFRGNGMASAGITHAKRDLSDAQTEWVRGLPRERVLFDGLLKVVHDHPTRRDHYTYPEQFSADLLGGEDVLVLGHTHVQAHEAFSEGVVLNPGSVGQPRDRDPRAAYALVEVTDSGVSVEERRVAYDTDAVADAVREAGLPKSTASRLRDGR
ncbi:metallophosphoesterase [Salarchaeum sp. JOR-1]|uniref:metallophosphoesterase family protein n=1 Tax=Salarchaeum sp. JOR-1 TaxID=2599399 RepID=UPI00119860F5|nr:metallophosphoesterase family protein [Salarchaeum sp. JOR-1]QDX40201.1 metallophosphoesterase family protein [Salarchaeum sp. JOR-1]